MRESIEEFPCDRELPPDLQPLSHILWEGVLSSHVIEFGPSGSFAIGGKLALTCWPADVRRLLEGSEGKYVKIVITETSG